MKLYTYSGATPTEALKNAQSKHGEDVLVIKMNEIRKKTLTQSGLYELIVADETNEDGIIMQVNNPPSLPDADKYILAFNNENMVYKINTNHSFLYCTYPGLEIIKQTT